MTASEIDVKQFNDCKADSSEACDLLAQGSDAVCDTPVIRKLEKNKQSETTTTRGRKRKYNTPEERLEARRLQQKAYRERKREIANKLKQTSDVQKHDD